MPGFSLPFGCGAAIFTSRYWTVLVKSPIVFGVDIRTTPARAVLPMARLSQVNAVSRYAPMNSLAGWPRARWRSDHSRIGGDILSAQASVVATVGRGEARLLSGNRPDCAASKSIAQQRCGPLLGYS